MVKEESMRVIAPTLLTPILLSNVACCWQPSTRLRQRELAETNLANGNPAEILRADCAAIWLAIRASPARSSISLRIPAGSRVAGAHQHSVDVHVKVLSGSMFIILRRAARGLRARNTLRQGGRFVVPAQVWHDEWWDEETI